MSEGQKINYAMVEDLANKFGDVATLLEEFNGEVKKVTGQLRGGVLTGATGERLAEVLEAELKQAIEALHHEMCDLDSGLKGVVQANRDGVTDVKSMFI